jgi:hypothetical protein
MSPDHRHLLGAVALAALFAAGSAAAQLPAPPASSPGPLSVGGYAALTLRAEPGDSLDGDLELNEAAVALLVSGTPWQRVSYFAELEAASVSRETFSGREDREWKEVERAYLELTLSDALRLRLGRSLTPVGQWNEIHAAPLTWTAARPLTSYRAFAKSVTGAMLAGQVVLGPRDAGYAAWVAPFGRTPNGEESSFLRAAGGRVVVEVLPDLYLGLSGASLRASRRAGGPEPGETEEEDDDDIGPRAQRAPDPEEEEEGDDDDREEDSQERRLAGADLSWRIGGLHLLSEATWLGATHDSPGERGAFLQAALPLARGLHVTARAEGYDPVGTGSLRIYTAGLNWRPNSRLALKLERQVTDRPSRRVADGWLVSFSGLF